MSENWAEEAGFVGRRGTWGGAQNGAGGWGWGLGLGLGLTDRGDLSSRFSQHPAAAARQSRGAAAKHKLPLSSICRRFS